MKSVQAQLYPGQDQYHKPATPAQKCFLSGVNVVQTHDLQKQAEAETT